MTTEGAIADTLYAMMLILALTVLASQAPATPTPPKSKIVHVRYPPMVATPGVSGTCDKVPAALQNGSSGIWSRLAVLHQPVPGTFSLNATTQMLRSIRVVRPVGRQVCFALLEATEGDAAMTIFLNTAYPTWTARGTKLVKDGETTYVVNGEPATAEAFEALIEQP
jgi:hypothetical protein